MALAACRVPVSVSLLAWSRLTCEGWLALPPVEKHRIIATYFRQNGGALSPQAGIQVIAEVDRHCTVAGFPRLTSKAAGAADADLTITPGDIEQWNRENPDHAFNTNPSQGGFNINDPNFLRLAQTVIQVGGSIATGLINQGNIQRTNQGYGPGQGYNNDPYAYQRYGAIPVTEPTNWTPFLIGGGILVAGGVAFALTRRK